MDRITFIIIAAAVVVAVSGTPIASVDPTEVPVDNVTVSLSQIESPFRRCFLLLLFIDNATPCSAVQNGGLNV